MLNIVEPGEAETLTANPTLLVSGRTRVDAVVTVNDTFVDPDIDGRFSAEIPLDEGPNIIEVVASIATGEELSTVLVVIYEPYAGARHGPAAMAAGPAGVTLR